MAKFLSLGAVTALGLGLVVALPFAADAAVITGVTATANSTINPIFNRQAQYTVDGSGLSGGAHTNDPGGTMWLSDGGMNVQNPTITFSLGGLYDVTGAQVWNYNELNNTARGIDTMSIQVSTDNVTYSTIANVTLSQATGLATYTGQALSLTTSAAYIRFANLTSFAYPGGINGQSDGYVGLAEVQFSGTLSNVSVPEPASLALLTLGAAGVVGVRRRGKAGATVAS